MSFELKLRQQHRNYQEISELKEEIKRLIQQKREAHAIVKHCAQKIPELYKELFGKMDNYDKTW